MKISTVIKKLDNYSRLLEKLQKDLPGLHSMFAESLSDYGNIGIDFSKTVNTVNETFKMDIDIFLSTHYEFTCLGSDIIKVDDLFKHFIHTTKNYLLHRKTFSRYIFKEYNVCRKQVRVKDRRHYSFTGIKLKENNTM